MKKYLLILMTLIGMMTMVSCDDKSQYVGEWVSDTHEEDDFSAVIHLTLQEGGTAYIEIKARGVDDTTDIPLKVTYTMKTSGKWDASLGFLDLEFDPNKVKCDLDDIKAEDPTATALIRMVLADSETRNELKEELTKEVDVTDFNGSLEADLVDDNTLVLTDDDGEVIKFYKK